MRARVEQSGNTVAVLTPSFDDPIVFEADGIELPELMDHSFAAWLMLPWAMKTGEPVEIDGPVDPVAADNMMRFARTWELWQPKVFSSVAVSGMAQPRLGDRAEEFVFYSGGLDSTDMLLQLGRRDTTVTALTVQGFDYAVGAREQFAALRDRIAPFLDALNYRHASLRVSRVAGGYHSWALQLAAAGFLFSGTHRRGLFASDYNWEQDLAAFPWGLNHVTNRYLRGAEFELESLCEDRTRTMKAEAALNDDTALRATSFCKRPEVRPLNCGTCAKCVRTKAMFAVFGPQPDIFLDRRFDGDMIRAMDLSNKRERAFFVELCQTARERGMLDDIPGMKETFESLKRPSPERRSRIDRIRARFGRAAAGWWS